jgi:parvulin-like peptidyl-prolyl isomerase
MHKLGIILILIILFFANLNSQSFKKNYVAKVGNLEISDEEFLKRYEFTPAFNRHLKSNTESKKIEFLFTLVAEKLWALEAIDQKLDTTEVIRFISKSFEKMFVRDQLFKSEVKNKIVITDQDLISGLNKKSIKLYVNFLFSEDYDEINSLHNLLNQGISFDSILAESPEKDEQINPIEIVFGQMEESIEDMLYNLKINEYTKPVLTTDGWYIFKVANRSEQMLIGEVDKDEELKLIKKTIEARRLIERQKEFYADFFKDKKVDVDPEIFEDIAQSISLSFAFKKNSLVIADNELINLDVDDIGRMELKFGKEKLNKVFIKFSDNPIFTKDYLNMLLFDGFNSKEYKINYIRASLDERVRKDIEKELLYREGLKRGYDNYLEVKNEVEIWRANYLFQILREKFRDSVSVSEDEVLSYYEKLNQPESYPMLVNIVEVLTDSIENVEKIFEEINSGVDIKTVAKKYNKREWTKKKDGEYGLFAISQYGEIGKIASTMNVGDVYGPLKLPEGFSIFKLIDKQSEKIIPAQPFERVKNQYREELTFNKLNKKMTDYTYKLAVKHRISLNIDRLQEIQVTTLPSFAIRYIGFGGKITAVPILAPNVDWADEWIRNQQQPQVIP